ncbi:hypothetical protein RR11_2841 [Ruegeria sp. R11]|nr:hypothetical protein RR11_2841 [Ruegeria sp. R11]
MDETTAGTRGFDGYNWGKPLSARQKFVAASPAAVAETCG